MGIDLYFAGLMLICLGDQMNCLDGSGLNTAWVLQATKEDSVCDWKSYFGSVLQLVFDPSEISCKKADGNPCRCVVQKNPDGIATGLWVCDVPLPVKAKICVDPGPMLQPSVDAASLQALPQIDEVDRRFTGLNLKRLGDSKYVSTRILFPAGKISAASPWHSSSQPAWFRSNDDSTGKLPRPLSDRLRVSYKEAKTIKLTTCRDYDVPFMTITRKVEYGSPRLIIQNAADKYPEPVPSGGYDTLPYLYWYYTIGLWENRYRETCPDKAVMLKCKREAEDKPCAMYDQRDTTFWPVMRGPSD